MQGPWTLSRDGPKPRLADCRNYLQLLPANKSYLAPPQRNNWSGPLRHEPSNRSQPKHGQSSVELAHKLWRIPGRPMASLPVDLSAYIEKPTVAWHVTTFVDNCAEPTVNIEGIIAHFHPRAIRCQERKCSTKEGRACSCVE